MNEKLKSFYKQLSNITYGINVTYKPLRGISMDEKLKAIFKQQYNITYQKARDLHDFIYNKKTDYDTLQSDMQISLVILLHKMWDECEIYKLMIKRMGEDVQ